MSKKLARVDYVTDIGFKFFSIVAICFGGLRYFQEREEAVQNEALDRSLTYIEEYGGERYLAARLALHDFWSSHPELVQFLTQSGIPERVYRAALSQEVFRFKADSEIHEALLLLDNFYSQIAFCHRSDLCDANVLTEFFCPVARSEAVAYAPFFDRMAAETGDSDLGRDLEVFRQACDAANLKNVG